MRGRYMHSNSTSTNYTFQPYGSGDKVNSSGES